MDDDMSPSFVWVRICSDGGLSGLGRRRGSSGLSQEIMVRGRGLFVGIDRYAIATPDLLRVSSLAVGME